MHYSNVFPSHLYVFLLPLLGYYYTHVRVCDGMFCRSLGFCLVRSYSHFSLSFRMCTLNWPIFRFIDFFLLPGQICYRNPLVIFFFFYFIILSTPEFPFGSFSLFLSLVSPDLERHCPHTSFKHGFLWFTEHIFIIIHLKSVVTLTSGRFQRQFLFDCFFSMCRPHFSVSLHVF